MPASIAKPTWENFAPADLPHDARVLHAALVEARQAFEACMNRAARPGYVFRFAYRGEGFERMGMTEVAATGGKPGSSILSRFA